LLLLLNRLPSRTPTTNNCFNNKGNKKQRLCSRSSMMYLKTGPQKRPSWKSNRSISAAVKIRCSSRLLLLVRSSFTETADSVDATQNVLNVCNVFWTANYMDTKKFLSSSTMSLVRNVLSKLNSAAIRLLLSDTRELS